MAAVSLASQTLYLPAGGRKGSGNRAYNVSFPSPRNVGNNTLACIAYAVWFTSGGLEDFFRRPGYGQLRQVWKSLKNVCSVACATVAWFSVNTASTYLLIVRSSP